ncbi:hypothetical protein DV515_00007090 [Chloebia gouldiae]|uniref:Uncharacterized protein n=1 Tax=Chloebia gouldiae TaxID=44316 RepID=A0A3L8SIQ9_CHLGU|nr:hypothetical protein DV515_00007090 [Chloebia gouldiae]
MPPAITQTMATHLPFPGFALVSAFGTQIPFKTLAGEPCRRPIESLLMAELPAARAPDTSPGPCPAPTRVWNPLGGRAGEQLATAPSLTSTPGSSIKPCILAVRSQAVFAGQGLLPRQAGAVEQLRDYGELKLLVQHCILKVNLHRSCEVEAKGKSNGPSVLHRCNEEQTAQEKKHLPSCSFLNPRTPGSKTSSVKPLMFQLQWEDVITTLLVGSGELCEFKTSLKRKWNDSSEDGGFLQVKRNGSFRFGSGFWMPVHAAHEGSIGTDGIWGDARGLLVCPKRRSDHRDINSD